MRPETVKALLDALHIAIDETAGRSRSSQPLSAGAERPAMKEIANIEFADAETSEETYAMVRHGDGSVAVLLSNEDDGDIEVVMRSEDARTLRDALGAAVGA